MILEIADSILEKSQTTEAEIRLELGISLFQQNRITFGQACDLTGLDLAVFKAILHQRHILRPYTSNTTQKWQPLTLNIKPFPKNITAFSVKPAQLSALAELFENEPSAEELCKML